MLVERHEQSYDLKLQNEKLSFIGRELPLK